MKLHISLQQIVDQLLRYGLFQQQVLLVVTNAIFKTSLNI